MFAVVFVPLPRRLAQVWLEKTCTNVGSAATSQKMQVKRRYDSRVSPTNMTTRVLSTVSISITGSWYEGTAAEGRDACHIDLED